MVENFLTFGPYNNQNTTMMNAIAETLKVGDKIRVNNLMTGATQVARVAALWPEDKAISVDLRSGKRLYFRSNVMDVYYLPDISND